MAKVVNVQEAKTRLSQLLRLVEAGEEVSIARAGRVIARLVRADAAAPREWGAFESSNDSPGIIAIHSTDSSSRKPAWNR